MGDLQGAQQPHGAARPGAGGQHGHFHPRWPAGGNNRCCGSRAGALTPAHQHIGSLEHQGAGFQVPAPHVAGPIGEAQVQVHPCGAHRAVEGDDFQIPLHHRGFRWPRALKSGPGQVAHHTQHKTGGLLLTRQLLKTQAQVIARGQFDWRGAHEGRQGVR